MFSKVAQLVSKKKPFREIGIWKIQNHLWRSLKSRKFKWIRSSRRWRMPFLQLMWNVLSRPSFNKKRSNRIRWWGIFLDRCRRSKSERSRCIRNHPYWFLLVKILRRAHFETASTTTKNDTLEVVTKPLRFPMATLSQAVADLKV